MEKELLVLLVCDEGPKFVGERFLSVNKVILKFELNQEVLCED